MNANSTGRDIVTAGFVLACMYLHQRKLLLFVSADPADDLLLSRDSIREAEKKFLPRKVSSRIHNPKILFRINFRHGTGT